MAFRYGIEHELALVHTDGRFADHTTLRYADLRAVVDRLPADPADAIELHMGDQGIKAKRWYVEGYERFDDAGTLVRYDCKGMEIRTRIHGSVEAVLAALAADVALLVAELERAGLRTTAIGFNPVRSGYRIDPPFTAWELAHVQTTPEERTDFLHMDTFGPDLNLSHPDLDAAGVLDVGRKLTHYSPWLVPLAFSSPWRDGTAWGGLSARTFVRTGTRPATLVYLADAAAQVDSSPSLTRVARLPSEVGRIEFKAFDASADLTLYGELLTLLSGLVRDTSLTGRATVPDTAAHRHVATVGLADDAVHTGTGELIDAATAALAGRPADLARMASLRARWEARECPATVMLAGPNPW